MGRKQRGKDAYPLLRRSSASACAKQDGLPRSSAPSHDGDELLVDVKNATHRIALIGCDAALPGTSSEEVGEVHGTEEWDEEHSNELECGAEARRMQRAAWQIRVFSKPAPNIVFTLNRHTGPHTSRPIEHSQGRW